MAMNRETVCMAKMGPPSATIRDVARLSGVSIATVTRTFQGSPKVRPETRERVLAAAAQLGYQPDAVAQALVTGSTNTVGVLVPSIRVPYWSEVTHGIEQLAGTHGYSVVVASSGGDPDQERRMLDLLLGKRLDGVIVGGAAGNAESWSVPNRRTPLVLLEWDETPRWDLLDSFSAGAITSRTVTQMTDQRVPGPWAANVVYDDVAGGRLVARHLHQLGHREVAFVAGPPVRTCLLRLLGFRQAFQESGVDAGVVVAADDSFDAARTAVREYLAGATRPTALACYSDMLAIGAIKAARDLGLNVPGDVSVVGYDDIEFAEYVDPPLTTLRNPKQQLGELAFDLVLAARSAEPRGERHTLAGRLIERSSTSEPTRAEG
ncbi:LacI family DNA-binding transcriptional regulator [Kribbella solani]|uniref:LacI family DNA-binding transcriptional regulator n=2 Tax=Kribbella solani TaxID=236067 RepID=UPI0029A2483A|nr:LacI family DNA-binding transcriptional regulator [Kribbella solani]MDX2968127.1 LacI family DNA-binding transcriptional regulator [Kribbella solani]MDX3004860.1 LacI family DNA-binding transcriptional regulator [Kribbella solani]